MWTVTMGRTWPPRAASDYELGLHWSNKAVDNAVVAIGRLATLSIPSAALSSHVATTPGSPAAPPSPRLVTMVRGSR